MRKSIFLSILLSILVLMYFGIVFASHQGTPGTEIRSVFPTPQNRYYVYGKILYPNGLPAAEAHISTFRKYPPSDDSVREFNPTGDSENNGDYEIEFPKPGTYDLCAWKQAKNYLLPNVLFFGLSPGGKCETVTIGDKERININVTLGPQASSLKGRIIDWEAISRSSEATVVVYRPIKHIKDGKGKVNLVLTSLDEADWDEKTEVKPNEKGEFVVNGLPEGDYFLRLEFPDQETWFYKAGADKDPTPIHIRNKAKNEIKFSFYEMSGRAVVKVKKTER